MKIQSSLLALTLATAMSTTMAQTNDNDVINEISTTPVVENEEKTISALTNAVEAADALPAQTTAADALPVETTAVDTPIDTLINVDNLLFPRYYFTPVVFDTYDLKLTDNTFGNQAVSYTNDITRWVDQRADAIKRFRRMKQEYMMANPQAVEYNIATLPEAPKQYVTYVDPSTSRITIEEVSYDKVQAAAAEVLTTDLKPIHWLYGFEGLIQFSQAYVSPNWYQGGNNSLNAIGNAVFNIKLNQALHPNLLFENTIQYKLALAAAPEDSLRNYSISEDIFQLNSKFGVRAAKRWYYSATLQFKTQMLNNYKTNTTDLTAAFLSPAELNIGLGMTYEYISPSKNFNLTVSLAPLSYNLKTCTNKKIDETIFGIEKGKSTVSQIGSGLDTKLSWNITHNVGLVSHLTAFSDYSYIQSDWENTLSFSVNKFLSTQIYVHMRYDTQTPPIADSKWKKLQVKEILSFGLTYKFSRI